MGILESGDKNGAGAILLETDRLVLCPIHSSDFNELFRMNSDPIDMKYVGDGSTRNHVQMLKEMEMLTSYYKKGQGWGHHPNRRVYRLYQAKLCSLL